MSEIAAWKSESLKERESVVSLAVGRRNHFFNAALINLASQAATKKGSPPSSGLDSFFSLSLPATPAR